MQNNSNQIVEVTIKTPPNDGIYTMVGIISEKLDEKIKLVFLIENGLYKDFVEIKTADILNIKKINLNEVAIIQ